MHPVLRDPDILSEIFKHFALPARSRGSQVLEIDHKTCKAIVLTCRTFASPGLDILWQELSGIRPLVRLIPGVTIKNGRLVRDIPLCISDLDCLQAYARRVRYLNLRCDNPGDFFHDIHPLLLTQLHFTLQNGHFLPCLRILKLLVLQERKEVNPELPPDLTLFISPMLEMVDVDIWQRLDGFDQAPTVWLFLQALASSPIHRLKELILNIDVPSSTFISLSQIATLERLELDFARPCARTLRDIAPFTSLQNLHSITLRLSSDAVSAQLQDLRKNTFRALTKAQIHTNPSSANWFFSTFRFPALKTISFTIDGAGRATAEQWSQFLQSVVEHAPNVQSFWIDRQAGYGRHGLTWPSFWPLDSLQLTDLKVLRCVGSLSNEDFSHIASAWPRLQNLHVQTDRVGTIDHHALIVAAEKLPELQQLHLSIRMSAASPTDLPGPNTPRNKLPLLDLMEISDNLHEFFSVSQVYQIARFLAALFPHMWLYRQQVDHLARRYSNLQYIYEFLQGSQEDLAQNFVVDAEH